MWSRALSWWNFILLVSEIDLCLFKAATRWKRQLLRYVLLLNTSPALKYSVQWQALMSWKKYKSWLLPPHNSSRHFAFSYQTSIWLFFFHFACDKTSIHPRLLHRHLSLLNLAKFFSHMRTRSALFFWVNSWATQRDVIFFIGFKYYIVNWTTRVLSFSFNFIIRTVRITLYKCTNHTYISLSNSGNWASWPLFILKIFFTISKSIKPPIYLLKDGEQNLAWILSSQYTSTGVLPKL